MPVLVPRHQRINVFAATGHRPPKLGGYTDVARRRLENFAIEWLAKLQPKHIISGMALGWDQAVAVAARGLEIPWTAAIPFEGQESKWPRASKIAYLKLLASATKTVVVSPGTSYGAGYMQQRNEWMVDRCQTVLALYNGSPGGTANCLAYATAKRRTIINLWEDWKEAQG